MPVAASALILCLTSGTGYIVKRSFVSTVVAGSDWTQTLKQCTSLVGRGARMMDSKAVYQFDMLGQAWCLAVVKG